MAFSAHLCAAVAIALLLQVEALRVQPAQKAAAGSRPLQGTHYSQELGNLKDLQYFGDIDIGGQTLRGILDTGSYELVVFSARCSGCGIAGQYNEANSRSYEKGQMRREHAYGSGSCVASDGFDNVTVGPFGAPKQALWLAQTCEMKLLAHASFNAIVGLGPPGAPLQMAKSRLKDLHDLGQDYEDQAMEVPDEVTSMEKDVEQEIMFSQSKSALLENFGVSVFSACLGREPGSAGWLIWNDDIHIQGSGVTRFPITDRTAWRLELSSVAIGNHVVGCTNGCGAVVDTGTSLFTMASDLYDSMLALLNSLPFEGVPLNCSDLRHFDDLVLKVGDRELRFPPSSYLGEFEGQAQAAASSFVRSPEKRSLLMSRCELLIMDLGSSSSKLSEPAMILGMPFFREYYTSFSLGSGAGDRSIYVSEADDNCRPAVSNAVDSHIVRKDHAWKPRKVDASKIRVSWRPEIRVRQAKDPH